MTLRRTPAMTIALAATCGFVISNSLVAQSTNPTVTYTASGTFASTATGPDGLGLVNEPFSVSVLASADTAPYQRGTNWCAFNKLKLVGTVHAAIVPGSPAQTIGSTEATVIEALDPGVKDVLTMEAPIKITKFEFTIKAAVALASGTFSKPLIHPFSAAELTPTNSTVTVTYDGTSTVYTIQKGMVVGTIPGSSSKTTALMLHAGGAESVILHGDGTESVRPIGAGPVDLGMPTDTVRLRFYATGVNGASDVRVEIGGQEVPVIYAGSSGYFRGLDEVMVEVPRSLVGRGDTEVALTADGQTAEPVHIQIQ